MADFSLQTKLNENNIQAPFQYLPAEDEFELKEVSDEFLLNNNSGRVKYFAGQKLFCVDLGYSIDGDLAKMNILIDNTKIYPVRVNNIEDIHQATVNENNYLVVSNDLNFKSIIFLPISQLEKKIKYTITSYASTLSSWMFDEIAKKINGLDTNYPVKNLYKNDNYKTDDIIKNNGYLYKVLNDFLNNAEDNKILLANSMILTPFRRLEDGSYNLYNILEKDNQFFICQKNFVYKENETDLSNCLTPLIQIITWADGINKIYKNSILIKKEVDNIIKKYLVLKDVAYPVWNDLIKDNDIIELYTAKDILYNNEETNNLQDGLDLAFKKIANNEKEINNKQKTLEADDNIEITNNTSDDKANIKVIINNKYDLNYKKSVFPKIAYEIPDEIIFNLSPKSNTEEVKPAPTAKTATGDIDNNVNNVNNFQATIKKIDGAYTFKTTITITETKENITLNITNINAVDLSQFFTPNTTYELENCNLIFSLNDMTLTLTPKAKANGENGTFEAGNLTLEYTFITIYNKNIFFITQNNGYIELKQDETAGEPKGSIVKFEKSFDVYIAEPEPSEPTADGQEETEETGVDFVELDILNNVIAQYFNTIENFNINNFIETDGIYFVRTTQEGDAEPVITTEKANFGMILDTQNNYYRFGICRRDKGKIKNNDTVVISIYPDLNKQLDTVKIKANNLNETLQSLTENIKETQNDLNTEKTTRENKDNELETKITEITNNLNTAINNEITNRKEADTELQNKINEETTNRTASDTAINELLQAESQKIGDLSLLETENKKSLVDAINELLLKLQQLNKNDSGV